MAQSVQSSLDPLLTRLRARFPEASPADWEPFETRLSAHFERLSALLSSLYGQRPDFPEQLEGLVESAARSWLARPDGLKTLDAERESAPLWFESQEMLGAACYVDLFAGDLAGIRAKIPYFKELGLTYLHLMPLFLSPAESDGGYAVSSYRETNPALGTMDELAEVAADLRRNGISLVLDFIYNHTSDEHAWAKRALAGDPEYQAYYFIFPDRSMPDAYDAHLAEIFPQVRRGNFSYRAEMDAWVWTTFHNFQWDLNYRNPVVLRRMAEEMLFLANVGAEVLRLDAVAFAWKELGTISQNLPQAHTLIQIFNALARIAAPALLFKSEAIVHPDEVARYIAVEECQLSYNPLLMASLWEALATQDTRLLQIGMQKRFDIDAGTAWVNYVRGHDDIGWGFADEDAAQLDIDGFEHRQFLNAFYTGQTEGSFARGVLFAFNPDTQDARIAGTCASLAGLERELETGDAAEIDLSIRRILLMHSVILSIGGIPVLFLGDEIGMLNDPGYRDDPAKADDSRWIHRPPADPQRFARRNDASSVEGRIFSGLRRMIAVRSQTPAFAGQDTTFIDKGSPQVFGTLRRSEGQRVLALANFSQEAQTVAASTLRPYGQRFTDLLTGETVPADDLTLDAYRFVWLETGGREENQT